MCSICFKKNLVTAVQDILQNDVHTNSDWSIRISHGTKTYISLSKDNDKSDLLLGVNANAVIDYCKQQKSINRVFKSNELLTNEGGKGLPLPPSHQRRVQGP